MYNLSSEHIQSIYQ